MMTAFLNGRYIYKNINPTTSKDDVIIMRYSMIYNRHTYYPPSTMLLVESTLWLLRFIGNWHAVSAKTRSQFYFKK